MSDETMTINMEALTTAVTKSVLEALTGITTGSVYELTEEQKQAQAAKVKEGNERKALLKRTIMGEVMANLPGIASERQANNLSRTTGAKARLMMAAMAACDAYDAGEARLDNRMARNFGVNPNPWS